MFSSLYGQPVPGLSFLTLSWMSTQPRRSYPTLVAQMVRTEAETVATQAKRHQKTPQRKKNAPQGKRGRPKGRKHKEKTHVPWSPERQRIQTMIHKQLQVIGGMIALTHMVLDGHFGNHNALHMVRGAACT